MATDNDRQHGKFLLLKAENSISSILRLQVTSLVTGSNGRDYCLGLTMSFPPAHASILAARYQIDPKVPTGDTIRTKMVVQNEIAI